jgi:hypothetical protein
MKCLLQGSPCRKWLSLSRRNRTRFTPSGCRGLAHASLVLAFTRESNDDGERFGVKNLYTGGHRS